jgi:hypothetical protein
MGTIQSKININAVSELNEPITVIRTSGIEQADWYAPSGPHICIRTSGENSTYPTRLAAKVADRTSYSGSLAWAVFMANRLGGEDHACGWRRVDTIYPTSLSGNTAAIAKWRNDLKNKFEEISAGQQSV